MKKNLFAFLYTPLLLGFSIYFILDTLVISETYEVVDNSNEIVLNAEEIEESKGEVASTDNSYQDENININIKEYRENNTTIYVADVLLKDPSYLKTAFAKNSYGKNITETTSDTADSVNAILAINGDYYGVQETGYVLKNGKIYRSTAASKEDLVIYKDGSWEIINEDETDINTLLNNGAYNILSFGPGLLKDGYISVSQTEEVGKAMRSNPRTAIGYIDENHYVFVVSDGRTEESEGLSLYQLAQFMKTLGCTTAYNLDGGGSSSMVFQGNIVNNPVSMGRGSSERKVSDIVYIGY